MKKVECKKCGKKYTLNDDEDPKYYSCECGGELRKVQKLFDLFVPLCITVLVSVLLRIQLEWLPVGLFLLIELWINRDVPRSDLSIFQKFIMGLAAIYILIIWFSLPWKL